MRDQNWQNVFGWIDRNENKVFSKDDMFMKTLKLKAVENMDLDFIRDTPTDPLAPPFEMYTVFSNANFFTYTVYNNGDANLLLKLLERGVDVDQPNRLQRGRTALSLNSYYWTIDHVKRCEIAGVLLDNHAKINLKDFDGQTALMHAASVGDNKFVQFLLDRGANKHLTNNSGETALDVTRKTLDHRLQNSLSYGSNVSYLSYERYQNCIKILSE